MHGQKNIKSTRVVPLLLDGEVIMEDSFEKGFLGVL